MSFETMPITESYLHPQTEEEKLLERRRNIQKGLSRVGLILSEAGITYQQLVADMLENNREAKALGVDLDVHANYHDAPRIDEVDELAVRSFLDATQIDAPMEPQFRIKPELA